MNDVNFTVLDHIEQIKVPGRPFEEPANEYWALVYLWRGLEFLYKGAVHCDLTANKLSGVNENVQFQGFGNIPQVKVIPNALLTCSFQWYAVTACQYVRTIGQIAKKHGQIEDDSLVYLKKVIPEVYTFRNKVAAHFVWNCGDKRDNDAERTVSVMPNLGFTNGSFHICGMSVALSRGGKSSNSNSIKPWSICKEHELLRRRYWPEKHSDDAVADTA